MILTDAGRSSCATRARNALPLVKRITLRNTGFIDRKALASLPPLAQSIAQLDQREALVLQLYFAEELKLHDIGEALGVGAALVCLQQMMTQNR